ncbi:MAG: hypothetical protein WD055_02550 [Candidatus Dependentiae bacterium]
MFHVTHIKVKNSTFACIFFMLFGCNVIDAYSIVFAHLGNTLPHYLADATHQARLFNTEARIFVIAENEAIRKISDVRFYDDKIIFVACESLEKSFMHELFEQQNRLDNGFRQGFWRKTTERFFLVHELMNQYQLEDVFHLEYDNMLYVDLNELLPVFHTYSNIAATFDNDGRCIAGFIYFAHELAIEKLVDFVAHQAKNTMNDMQIIAKYRQTFGKKEIAHLPIIMREYLDVCELKSTKGHTAQSPEDYAHFFSEFNSIFDAAALGQYLGGIDPRNGLSKSGFINESCLFDPSFLSFTWNIDQKGRRVPFARFGKTECRINNLHIHSKKLHLFVS